LRPAWPLPAAFAAPSGDAVAGAVRLTAAAGETQPCVAHGRACAAAT
jgi:hypothetical protein